MTEPEQLTQFASHLKRLFGVQTTEVRESSCLLCAVPDVSICADCPYAKKDGFPTHQYGVSEARRWGNRYMYYCPMGLLYLAFTPSAQELDTSLVIGPIVMGEPQDFIVEQESNKFRAELTKLPVMEPAYVHSLSELLYHAYHGLCTPSHPSLMQNGQNEFLNMLETLRTEQHQPDIECLQQAEEKLRQAVRDFDKAGAQKLLNELLGTMYLQTTFDLEAVKMHSISLLVMLSHSLNYSGVPAGADYLQQINRITSIEDLCTWMSETLHTIIDTFFRYTNIKHTDTIFKVMEYIRTNFDQKLTLEDISKNVFMSKAYLSMLFKQETGRGISEYITIVRIEKSKQLLRETNAGIVEIACACCFHDQSYFTKVFQRIVGVSPKKYRSQF